MRDNMPDSKEIRWEVLKSMLDSFPQLLDRAEKYILYKKNLAGRDCSDVKRLVREAVREYHCERVRK